MTQKVDPKTNESDILKVNSTCISEANSSNIFTITGIKRILEERGQWLGDLEGKVWKLRCGAAEPGLKSMCCASHFLGSRVDFAAQKTALQEAVENAGHIFELYPKYYCECNWRRIKNWPRERLD